VPFDPYAFNRSSEEQVSASELRINHYVTRSEDDLPLKFKDRHTMSEKDRRSYARYHDRNEVEDAILASKAESVREIIARVHAGKPPFALDQRLNVAL
jgi:hypothetical protein